jgi:DNA polymerase-1
MIEINKFLITNKLQSKMIMQVHDELVFSVKKTEKKLLEMEIKYIMENVLNYNKLNVQIPKNSVLLTVDF